MGSAGKLPPGKLSSTPESVFPTCINMKNKPDANAKEVMFNTPSP